MFLSHRWAVGCVVLLGGVASAAKPPDVSTHLWGQLEFKACALSTRGVPDPIDAFCAELKVPLDHSDPKSPSITLSIAWLKAEEKAGAVKEPSVFLAGGPGQAARDYAAYMGRALRSLRRRHHFLFIDQRGTGASSALKCPDLENAEPDASPTKQAALLKACREKFAWDSRFFTTADTVADLEDVRRAIGSPQFDLIGVSYGTRLAQEYARTHREGTRTMVLDGVVPPSLVLARNFGRSLDTALSRAVGSCEAIDGGCEVPLKVLDDALAALKSPQTVTFEDPFTGQTRTTQFGATELMAHIHRLAYQPLFIATFPQVFRDAREGHLGLLAAQSRIVARSAGIETGLHFAVACAEDIALLTDADAEAEGTSRMGREMIDTYRAACAEWPVREQPASRREALKSDVPTLLLSGEWDPVTPPEGAELVRSTLTNSKHLVLKGQGHNVIATGCLPQVVSQFVDRAGFEGVDATCVDRIRALKPFVNRTGWEP